MAHQNALAELKKRHDAGERRAALDALFHCFASLPNKRVPKWACDAFCKRFGDVLFARAASLNDAFGMPRRTEKQLKARRKRIDLDFPVWKHVRSLHASGQAIDEGMFEKVAKQFHIGKRRAKDLYYGVENAYGHRSNLWGDPVPTRQRRGRAKLTPKMQF